MFSVIAASPEQTWRIGELLGRALGPGDVVCLYGDLGSGKTNFSYGIALGLEVDERYITSPTFAFANEYQGRTPLYHIDLYRIKDHEELENIGFEHYVGGDGVTLIEWADRAEEALPAERLSVYLTHVDETSREIGFFAEGERYENLLEGLRRSLRT